MGWGGGSRPLRCSSSTYRFGYVFVVAPWIQSPGAPNEHDGSLEAGSKGLAPVTSEEPALPEGLAGDDEPALPEGLGGVSDEPALPEGLGATPAEAATPVKKAPPLFDVAGFWDTRVGVRTRNDPYEKTFSMAETRLQLELSKAMDALAFDLMLDFVYDPILNDYGIDLTTGDGWLDLRKASVSARPLSFMDVKVGRQILTWGAGYLIFLNDMFPKDWNAFFIGRDTEYLKAPSDAVKVSVFSDLVNLDMVYMPVFESDRYIDGRRLSHYLATLGRRAGRDAIVRDVPRDRWFTDDEIAWRAYQTAGGVELALYGYYGYWKSPAGVEPTPPFRATFPPLTVYGASIRGNLGRGIANAEVAYYDGRNGRDPYVRNSEFRLLLGYEQEIAKELTLGVHYYLEQVNHFKAYLESLPPGAPHSANGRHVVTIRLTQLAMNQNLKLSLFGYWSPSDRDAYLRPHVHHKLDDHWSAEVGANVFFGRYEYTFFNQFAYDTNVFFTVRYGF